MNQTVTINTLCHADAAAVTALSGELGYTTSVEETESRIKALSVNKDHMGLAAVVDNKLVGWIHAFYTFRLESEPFVEIGGLVVAAAYRKKGIGKLLISQVAAWSKTRDIGKIRVRCNITRTSTHAFYIHAGFTEIKEQKVFDFKVQHQD